MTATTPIIVGGGPAGLATAASLKQHGIDPIVLDRHDRVGQSWRDRYERLHLHTPRIQSGLPGFPIPRDAGQWVPKDDFADYLVAYAEHHGIEPRHGVTVTRVERDGPDWVVATSRGEMRSPVVVIATGYNGQPAIPDWPGLDGFTGAFMHASEYGSATPWGGQDVLVVGTGNTGAEIAADLAESGAATVWLSIRTPPNIIPRDIAGVPVSLFGAANAMTPAAIADPAGRLLSKLTIGDLSEYGMPAPERGIISSYHERDRIPIIDVGLVAQVKAGRVTPVAAVESFETHEVVLADRTRLEPNAVIAATGYTTGLADIVGHLGVLDDRGRPTHHGPDTHPATPNLHFVGLFNPLVGLLNAIRISSKKTARAIAAVLDQAVRSA